MLVIVGGYFVISTFVFPDEPSDWPDFDDYFLRANRTVVGGMIVINGVIVIYAATLFALGASYEEAPIARNWLSLGAALLYLPGLIILWFAKSKQANLMLLVLLNALLL